MKPLEKNLRTKLERTIQDAREIAEKAAEDILFQYGAAEQEPPIHLMAADIELRDKLRIHARQLGDPIDAVSQPNQCIRLKEEIAYEHWHRMLFARFLAENHLLMDDDPHNPVSVTLAECTELASAHQLDSGWELAAKFASRMLPQIFRNESPVFKFLLPTEHRNKLERLVESLPTEVFTASDSLGWVYQFWQSRKKDIINKSEVKIGAMELPAVTQLFTEPYMVQFLLDNALGAWWASRRLSSFDLGHAASEEELRQKASIPGVPLTYLRFAADAEGKWVPIGGKFEEWPEQLSQLKVLDPCCGSGHFLVAALNMLVPMRMAMENLSVDRAVDAVLSENLHGLELDRRCVELAAFALAFAGWRFPGSGTFRHLPPLNLACSGNSINCKKEELWKLAEGNKTLEFHLDQLSILFKDAPLLGSLINPNAISEFKMDIPIDWDSIQPLLLKAISSVEKEEKTEMGVIAYGLALAASLMVKKYHWVITNVPYLAKNKQNNKLSEYCEKNYEEAKPDLATVFLDRCLEFCREVGNLSVVLPQNWLFLSRYQAFREKLLMKHTWKVLAYLGAGAFETISGEIVKAVLLSINRGNTWARSFNLNNQDDVKSHIMYGLDVSSLRTVREKEEHLLIAEIKAIDQVKQTNNPDMRIILLETSKGNIFEKYVISMRGIVSGDNDKWVRKYWEMSGLSEHWKTLQSTPQVTQYFSGREHIIDWRSYGRGMLRPGTANKAYERDGIAVGQMSLLPVTTYDGSLYDNNTAALVPYNQEYLPAIWCYCSSPDYNVAVRKIDQSLKVTNATLVKVPFDLEKWQKMAEEKYPNGLPKPYSDDPTQWIFHGHPAQAEHPLQVAVARLLGYQWPAEQDEKMELSDEARQWVAKCRELHSHTDKDGIVCLPPVRGELSAANRLLNLLAAAYGPQWDNSLLNRLLKDANHEGKDLETWLNDKFFTQHCTLFQQRPFIWHIWDGLRDGFSALVNYHKLDRKNLETLIYLYLGDWINRRKEDAANNVDGAEEKLKAAQDLKKKLELILTGENPYDIFVRWKPLEKQPVGWDPDLNDGVRLNIRPFMTVPDVGKKGAGVLKDKPNIDWKKDRGKDVETAPWYHLFKGDRENDYHLSLEEKQKARERKKES